jgi:squalene-hopene/tetraprenyl-beta-curcumene cyclase
MMKMKSQLTLAVCIGLFVNTAHAQTSDRAQASVDRALAYLAKTQDTSGGWTKKYGPAVTAIVARGFADDAKYGPTHPVVSRALENILKHQQSDGGIYDRSQNIENYQTSVALMFLGDIKDPKLEGTVKRAQAFLTNLQYDEAEKIDKSNVWYGGAGYDNKKRPDLSNTQMMIEALHSSGLPTSDPVYQKALVFISRCQSNEATNDQPYARGMTDGGFIYSTNEGGESKASEAKGEIRTPLRSYGSMTYAGFKSMLHADVKRDDPRIKACLKWIQNNYTLDQNPGMPSKQKEQGLYYYYHVFARALDAWGEPTITDAAGRTHDWRRELCDKLVSLQRADGSWANQADRWLEGDSMYVTGLTVNTLQVAVKGTSHSVQGAR